LTAVLYYTSTYKGLFALLVEASVCATRKDGIEGQRRARWRLWPILSVLSKKEGPKQFRVDRRGMPDEISDVEPFLTVNTREEII